MPYLSSTSSGQTWQLRVPLTPWAVIGWRDCDYKRVHHLFMVRCFATLLQMTWFSLRPWLPSRGKRQRLRNSQRLREGLLTTGWLHSSGSPDKSNARPLVNAFRTYQFSLRAKETVRLKRPPAKQAADCIEAPANRDVVHPPAAVQESLSLA